jgi:NAD(P)-dependent dehydrogenase (short-subunit alcohol dehydrogenase family)
MNKPVTIVTGASRGIGHEVCLNLADQGHHIVALARTIGGLEDLADKIGDENITLIPQDLTDGAALEKLGPLLFEKLGRLDNFIANAGLLGTLCPLSQCDPTEWNRVFAVNVTANMHLIRTLTPLLKSSDNAHAIFVTSSVAKQPRAYWGAYAASKAALENMVETYKQEMTGANINISIFDPGGTATKMRASAFPGEDPNDLPTAKETAAKLVKLLKSDHR